QQRHLEAVPQREVVLLLPVRQDVGVAAGQQVDRQVAEAQHESGQRRDRGGHHGGRSGPGRRGGVLARLGGGSAPQEREAVGGGEHRRDRQQQVHHQAGRAEPEQ